MRIPKNHLLTRELISRFGLEMAPFYNKAHAYFVQDKRIPERDYVEVGFRLFDYFHFKSGHFMIVFSHPPTGQSTQSKISILVVCYFLIDVPMLFLFSDFSLDKYYLNQNLVPHYIYIITLKLLQNFP
jgi:hypothetical protein